MTGSTVTRSAILAFVAFALAAPLAAAPAFAQTDSAPLTSGATSAGSCEPGKLGDGGTYSSNSVADGDIVRAEIAYQCTRTLDDGTYVPEGYRVRFFRVCESGTCEMPFGFATAGSREVYAARIDDDGESVVIRMRENNRGRLVLTAVTNPGGSGERERARYTLARED